LWELLASVIIGIRDSNPLSVQFSTFETMLNPTNTDLVHLIDKKKATIIGIKTVLDKKFKS
jgi:hypothetical protein